MNCPNCGTVNVDAARFCVNCGQPLVKACANCGTELPATARFCHNCGRPQAAGNPIARTTANPTFSAGEAMVAGLSADDLARTLDLSAQGLGHRTVSWIFNALIIGHLNNMAGEISCLKGLQGAKGYPF